MLDHVAFPTSGGAACADWLFSRTGLGADADFNQLRVGAVAAASLSRNSFVLQARYGNTTDGTAPLANLHYLGGFLDLSGFNQNEFTGQNVARIGAVVYRRVTSMVYLGLSAETGNVWNPPDDVFTRSWTFGGSVWGGADTLIGPVYVGYGRAEGGFGAFYFVLGYSFIGQSIRI